MAYSFRVTEGTSRTVLVISAAVVAGGMIEAPAFAQASAPAAPKSVYPTPEFPTCVVKEPTDCRGADGHPILTGLWIGGNPSVGGGGGAIGSGIDNFDLASRNGSGFIGESDGALMRMSQVDSGNLAKPNFPMYRPEFWDQIVDNDYNGNFLDPEQMCLPLGTPRMGAPYGIIAIPGTPWVQFVYADMRSPGLRIRMIPTDGRPHNELNVAAETWNGDPVAHWEGDTLVVETVGFTDASWLHKNGYVHGFQMKVTERLTRTGNSLRWEAIVDDPEYLLEPWKITPVTRTLVTDPNATLYEALPCVEIDSLHTTSHTRST